MPFCCRLCHAAIDEDQAVKIGPFPQAAQYYPTPEEFATEQGTILNVVECDGCGLTQLTNEPVDYFRQVITAASLSPAIQEQRLAAFSELRKHFPESARPTALEIGCGNGDNLPLLREVGFHAMGLECHPDLPQGQTDANGVTNQYLLDLDDSHCGKYDLLTSFNYLEHQPDSRAFLLKCNALLSPGGRLLLTVPNLDYLLSSRSGHEFVADHLVYFTVNSLETALRITGFQLLDLTIINNQYDIQVLAKKRERSPIQAASDEVDHLVNKLNAKLRAFAAAGKTVAIWGAGHRTLALISLAEHQLIHCIIDSAKFKHHKFSPISHLEILPPETLHDEHCGIDVILVMVPGIYPAEVVRRIRSMPHAYHAEQFPEEEPSAR